MAEEKKNALKPEKKKREKKVKAKKNKKKEASQITFVNSLRFRILALAIGGALLVTVLLGTTMVLRMRSVLLSNAQTMMEDLTEAYGTTIEDSTSRTAALKLTYSELKAILGGVKVNEMSSSYFYLVQSDGMMLYHPVDNKIGQPVENSVILGVVDELANGNVPEPAFVTYEYNGTTKLAAYRVLSNYNILILTADASDVYAAMNSTLIMSTILALIGLVIVIFLAISVSGSLMRPLVQLSGIVGEMSELRFVKHSDTEKLKKRKDEIGLIYNSVSKLRRTLEDTVTQINDVSNNLHSAMNDLETSSNAINLSCSDNSATTQQLAAGMEETTATTETINAQIVEMRQESDEIRQFSIDGEQLSEEIETRANDLQRSSSHAVSEASRVVEEVRAETAQAIEDSKVVGKINELTKVIMEISSQTSLLALNASIEAARAGEAGRGFAVVASEIGTLANQTSDAVSDINAIVEEVGDAVLSMTKSMNRTTDFLADRVLPDYDNFVKVSDQYVEDSHTVKNSMATIQDGLKKLNSTIASIAEGIEGINATLGDSAAGVTDIAAKTTDVVGKTSDNETLVKKCKADADDLKSIADQFEIEA